MYIKSKPGRFGMKLWVAADVETSYLLNIKPYTGKIVGNREINQAERVVTDLITPFYGTGRGVTVDNFFTSISLASKLLVNNITLTGTIRSNKPDVPIQFKKSPKRKVFSSMFGFSGDQTLVSYVPKKNYAVNLLSTEHYDTSLEDSDRKRPIIILHYNKTKGGVDNADKMTESYTCARATRRWPFKIFMDMIGMAALNAYIIWSNKNPDWRTNDRSKRHLFIRQLAIEMAKENVIARKTKSNNLAMHIRDGFELFENSNNISGSFSSDIIPIPQQQRNRCFFCPRIKDAKVKSKCYTCKRFVCPKHTKNKKIASCYDCDSQPI